jgi:hypothetical protein
VSESLTETADAFRAAVAMIRVAGEGESAESAEAVGALWNGTENKPALVWALARVPGLLIAHALGEVGLALDLDGILGRLAAHDFTGGT